MLLVLALAVLALGAAGCGADERPRPAGFAAAASAAVRDDDAVVLDVRTDEEHAAGHAPRAIHLPLAEIERGARPDVPKETKLFVYCRTGRRAGVAARILREAGFTDVTNIGGLRDWERAGGDVAR